jgi:hypothetical protein
MVIPTLFSMMLVLASTNEIKVPASFHGSEAFFDFRKSGHELLAEKLLDSDGDGLLEALVVEQCQAGIGLSLWKANPSGDFKLIGRSERVPASTLVKFETFLLGKTDQAYLLDVLEDSPDEADHWVRLFLPTAAGLRQIFSARYQVQHSEEDAGRTPVKVVDLGGLSEGLMVDKNDSEWQTLRVRHDPKRVLSTRGSEEVRVVLGMRERVFKPREGIYREVEDRYLDYVPVVTPATITASSEKAGAGIAAFAIDGNTESAWIEGKSGTGTGESLTLTFPRPVSVRLIRLIPGCAANQKDWARHNRIQRVGLTFDAGVEISSAGESGSPNDPLVEGCFEVTVPGKEYATQKLIVLSKPIPTSHVTLTIKAADNGSGLNNETCLSELSVHESGHFNASVRHE